MNNRVIYVILLFLGVFLLFGAFLSSTKNLGMSEDNEKTHITSFKECADAGFPIMESYPRQCRTNNGVLFVEELGIQINPPRGTLDRSKDGCIITGCSSHVCADKEMVTTCEFRPEYVCYQNTICKRDLNNQCWWEETEELSLCLSTNKAIPQARQIQ